ncbi:DUF2256 domain-containing protein [Rhodoferax sp.]|jgi:hypothetical protein|uniref:DUF2256 domain-containing protein n=1 Tax=Rhodoferax sp. TaxID=50421 RepID=UPI003782E148
MKNDFKGNKSALPSKPCAVCQRPMSWRKAWGKNWESVRYCSDACRAKKATTLAPAQVPNARASVRATPPAPPVAPSTAGPKAAPARCKPRGPA